MKKPVINTHTPYSQTIDAAFKMLRLCNVTYNVVNGIIFVIGRDGLVYNTLAATTEYVTPPTTQPEPPKPPKSVAPIPTRTRQAALPLPDVAQVTHPEDKTKTDGKQERSLMANKNLPIDSRLRFRTRSKRRTHASVYEPYLVKLNIGDVAQVPIADIPEGVTVDHFRSAMSSWAFTVWGKSSHRTCVTDTHVELLRTK